MLRRNKSGGVIWAQDVAHMEQLRKVFRILIGKFEGGLGVGEVTALRWGWNKCSGSLRSGFL
jgi:hypothetical protein